MGKRRPSGDGMVRKVRPGLWEGRAVIGHKRDGSSIFKYAYAGTQKEITAKLRELVNTYQDRNLTEEMCLTLAEWLDRWCDEYLPTAVRESTADGYRSAIRNHILPYLGGKPVSSITVADVQRLCNELRRNGRISNREERGTGLSDTSVRRIHNILQQALDAAVREHLIPENPADGVQPPKRCSTPKQILNDSQLDTLMEAIKADEIWHDFFYTELTTGLRRGEICGLQWSDFETQTGVLHVRRSVRKENGKFVFGDTKTFAGRRAILLPPSTAKLLRKRKKAAIGMWIFPNLLKPEEPVNPGTVYQQLKRILRQAGLPDIRFHDLRHTFSSHAIASGVDPKTLAGILGHTNASFTLDTYAHVTDDMKKQASGIVGCFMEEIFGEELKPWENEKQAKV